MVKIQSKRRCSETEFEVKFDDDFSLFVKKADSSYEASRVRHLLKITGYTTEREFLEDKRMNDSEYLSKEIELFRKASARADRLATIDSIITNWKAMDAETGEVIEFSKKNVINFLLSDSELAHLIDEAALAAFNETNFWAKAVEEAKEQIKK